MERCIITKRLLSDDQVVVTGEGPVAIYLWGRKTIKMDQYGMALIPVELLTQLKIGLGRDPAPDVLEDGGKCLVEDE